MMKRLAFNTASNMLTMFLKMGFTFVMTPILIRNMGKYDYGLWEMIGGIIGYMGMLDLGVRPAVSRFAARYMALENQNASRRLYATTWYFLLAIGVFIAVVLSVWGVFFPHLLAEPGTPTAQYTWLMMILALQLLIVFPSYTAESFLEAYQEYYLKNNITIINTIIGNLIIIWYMTPQNALILLAAVNAVGICSKYLFLVWYMQFKRSFLSMRREYFSKAQLRELFSFSIKTVIQGLSTRMENATDSLVIGFILGPQHVPFYSIAAGLVNYIRGISYNLTHVFMPYFSALNATENIEESRKVYLVGSKYTVAPAVVLGLGVLLVGSDFLTLWVGKEIADASKPFLWILVSFTVLPLLNPLSSRYLTAIDKHVFFAKWQPFVALANLILSVILIYPLGIYGVALGSLIPAIVFQPVVLRVVAKELNMSSVFYLTKVILPWLLPALIMITIVSALKMQFVINSYFTLLMISFAGGLSFLISGFLFGLTTEEKAGFLSLIKRAFN